jgi:hypothetical protein
MTEPSTYKPVPVEAEQARKLFAALKYVLEQIEAGWEMHQPPLVRALKAAGDAVKEAEKFL